MRRLAVALASAAALLAAPPAAHAERTDDAAKPVLFVPDAAGCSAYTAMQTHLSEYSTSVGGKKVMFTNDLECVDSLTGDTVKLLAGDLGRHIASRYKNQWVDIVAHGHAGLVVRAALQLDPQLKIEDVVTLGTPHLSPEAEGLPKHPQGKGGTDWSVIASEADTEVPVESALGMEAAHKTVYKAGGPTHAGLLTDVSDAKDAKIRYQHDGGDWTHWNNAPHAVNRVAENLIFGGGYSGDCGIRDVHPELCGKTPIILVPGFGASELDCTAGGEVLHPWPDAILAHKQLWPTMSLAADGKSPLDPTNECARNLGPTGRALRNIMNLSPIHSGSVGWLNRIAPGRFFEFGWDFRKGPDQTLARLDRFIDDVRKTYGVSRVALVAHSYGGLLSRWYVDDPVRARKVARVANFGSPFWGAPKAWFSMAYGYESPSFSEMDLATNAGSFKAFSRNLTGLYYLFPPEAWFKNAPEPLRNWLEVDDKPITGTYLVADEVRAFGGNASLLESVAANHKKHISGFKRSNGVDWRIFVGSGVPALGHVRAYTALDKSYVQYSWVNGDGTVPLISQRQSASATGPQLGDRTPTYNFCEVEHMKEMETPSIQDAVESFVLDGRDPVVDGRTLRRAPCELKESEFWVTKDEDAKSIEISRAAEPDALKALHAAQDTGFMSLRDAESAGLLQLVDDGKKLVFIPIAPLHVHFPAGSAKTVQINPITGEGERGTGTVYDIPADGMNVTARGTQAVAAATDGVVLKGRKADTAPPKTKVKVRRSGARRILTATAKDASGVAVTMVKVGKGRAKPWTKRLKVSRRATVRYWSVDTLGNAERPRRLKLR